MEEPSRRSYHSPSPYSVRTRDISGFSDLVDEFFCTSPNDLNSLATDFVNKLDELPSDTSEIFEDLLEKDIKREAPILKTARERICQEFKRRDMELASTVRLNNNIRIGMVTPPRPVKTQRKIAIQNPCEISLSPPTSPACRQDSDYLSEEELVEDTDPIETKKNEKNSKKMPKPTRHYRSSKVDVTPPANVNGMRICSKDNCDGQVRPQMCGGNKHRWRCVNKHCRKWYGWVKANDQMPYDLGMKGRQSHVNGKQKKPDKPKRKYTRTAETRKAVQAILPTEEEFDSFSSEIIVHKRRRAPKRKASTATDPELEHSKREFSPLTETERKWRPSQMEKRTRWWINEKETNRRSYSPERELGTTMADAAAALRLISISFRAAAFAKADEPGSVNGVLDHLMDSLMGCMGPVLSLLSKMPNMHPAEGVVKQVWNASAIHIPLFTS